MLQQDVTMGRGLGRSLIEHHDRRPVLRCAQPRELPPGSAGSLRRPEVVVGIHSAEEISALLPVAIEEAATRGIPLCVFTAGRTVADRLVDSALQASEQVPCRLVRTMGERPSAALLRYLEPQDVLVLGARGPLRLAGLVAGSVSRAVLDAMPCDVLFVPMPPTAPNADPEEGRHE